MSMSFSAKLIAFLLPLMGQSLSTLSLVPTFFSVPMKIEVCLSVPWRFRRKLSVVDFDFTCKPAVCFDFAEPFTHGCPDFSFKFKCQNCAAQHKRRCAWHILAQPLLQQLLTTLTVWLTLGLVHCAMNCSLLPAYGKESSSSLFHHHLKDTLERSLFASRGVEARSQVTI